MPKLNIGMTAGLKPAWNMLYIFIYIKFSKIQCNNGDMLFIS